MWLIDLNYNFECDWLIELSNNRLSNNELSDNKLSDYNFYDWHEKKVAWRKCREIFL